MKKQTMLISFLLLPLLLFSCARAPQNNISAKAAAEEVIARCDENITFTAAGEDFAELNIPDLADVEGSAVYYAESSRGDMEFGVFRVEHAARSAANEAVLAYVNEQIKARESIAKLYPSERADFEASCFQNALVGIEGDFVYYFALDTEDAHAALDALRDVK